MEILKTVTAVSLTEKPIAQSLTTKLFLALKVISFSHPQSYFFLSEEGSLQGRLESEPVSSTDRDRGTRVRG